MGYELILDDVLRWAAGYTGPKFHCLFADPPYHLTSIHKRFSKPGSAPAKGGVYRRSSAGFMGAGWDGTDDSGLGIAFRPETWAALAQHLHPGGFILAFAGTRGYHRMACAMEDSGLIIHPSLVWVFCQGFPKATGIANQIDKAAGEKGRPSGVYQRPDGKPRNYQNWEGDSGYEGGWNVSNRIITAPATPLAQTWAGHRYGLQALKPALEFIAVAQKPYEGRPVDCITRTGAGAWNIEAGRIPAGEDYESAGWGPRYGASSMPNMGGHQSRPWVQDAIENNEPVKDSQPSDLGRWPANLLLSEEGAALLDRQSGESVSRHSERGPVKIWSDEIRGREGWEGESTERGHNDSGGASRMFFTSDWQYEILEQLANADPLEYEPKTSSSERNVGLDDFYWAITPKGFQRVEYEEWQALDPKKRAQGCIHPTLKPISLCKYLCELISPPDAYAPRRILVPFAGSGSEMIGAILAGFEEVVGIESNPDYHAIAEARLAWWAQWPGWGQTDVDKILASIEPKDEAPQATQLSLLPDEDTQARILKALEAK